MVKTFLCHAFEEQKEFTDQYNASCFCSTSDNRYIVGSSFGSINILETKSDGIKAIHKFSTVGIPVKIVFSDQRQFLISLEYQLQDYRTDMSTKEMNCQVRIYHNIMMGETQKQPQPVNSGYSRNIGTLLTPNNQEQKFTIIELAGFRQSITDVSLCKVQNNIAAASLRKIYIYAFKEHGKASNSCIDFLRLIEIEATFTIRSIALSSNWLAFSSKKELRVIQMHLNKPSDLNVYQGEEVTEVNETEDAEQERTNIFQEGSVQKENSVCKENNAIIWNFSSGQKSKSTNGVEEESIGDFIQFQSIKEEKSFVDISSTSKEILGEHGDLVGHPLGCSFVGQISTDVSYAIVSCTTHLYRRFEEKELSFFGEADKIHSLQWLPIFMNEYKLAESPTNDCDLLPWRMFYNATPDEYLLTLPIFFSTGCRGYLYDVYDSGCLITSYDYISDCHGAEHTNSLLYTMTSNGVEVYTSRLYSFAAEQCQKLIKEDAFYKKESLHKITARERTASELFLESSCFADYISINQSSFVDSLDKRDTVLLQPNEEEPLIPKEKEYTYLYDTLLYPCPPADLETCLIGMYPYQDLVSFNSTKSEMAMLVKPSQKRSNKSTINTFTWSLVTIQKPSVHTIYNEIKHLIDGTEFSNPTIYHQLLCESYLLLRSGMFSHFQDGGATIDSVKELALLISNFYMKCGASFDFSRLMEYYKLTDMQPIDVLTWMKEHNESVQKKNYAFGQGAVEYLNTILFSGDVVDFGKELNEFILNVYAKNSPSMIAKLILRSKLKRNYSLDICVKLLSKYKRKKESKGVRLSSFDHVCFAFMHMQLGNPGHAEELLKEIQDAALKEVCVENYDLLLSKNEKLTAMGQLLKKHFKATFQSVLVSLFEKGKIDAENILMLFKQSVNQTITYSYQVCEVFECILNDATFRRRYNEIIMLLVDQYLLRFGKGLRSECWKLSHNHDLKGNGHFASRFNWLDKLPPFSGDPPCPQDCILSHKKSNQNETIEKPFSKSAGNSSPSDANDGTGDDHQTLRVASSYSTKKDMMSSATSIMKSREYCPCCCCSEVLTKFQSLLCSKLCRKEMCVSILLKLDNHSFVGKESLQLLCWPKAENPKEATEYVMKNYAHITLPYAKDMFEWKVQWQILLQHTVLLLKSDNEQWNKNQYLDILKGVLMRLSRAFSPKQFLDLLPADSSVTFMLPYLLECVEYSNAMEIKGQILETYKTEVSE